MSFKALLTAICLLAVASQPLLAALRPCCCSESVTAEASCCPLCSEDADSEPACPHCSTATDTPDLASQQALRPSDCACKLATPPATAAEQRWTPHDFGKLLPIDFAVSSDNSLRSLNQSSFTQSCPLGRLRSGPPLLALHCIWLK